MQVLSSILNLLPSTIRSAIQPAILSNELKYSEVSQLFKTWRSNVFGSIAQFILNLDLSSLLFLIVAVLVLLFLVLQVARYLWNWFWFFVK
ncbi:hypothetical protein HK096_000197, partial [Nowakowskiella sp. JEL0078]